MKQNLNSKEINESLHPKFIYMFWEGVMLPKFLEMARNV